MTFTAKVLAEGTITSSSTVTIYTVPAATTAYIRTLSMSNVGTGACVITISIRPGSTDRVIRNIALNTGESAETIDFNAWCLSAGTQVKIVFDNASGTAALDYISTGVEET